MSPADRPSASLPVEDIHQPELEATTVAFDRQWQQSLLRPLLLTLMLGCVVTAVTYAFVVLIPAFTTSIANTIILCSALATLTACIAGAQTWDASRDLVARFKFRIMEPVGWALILRLGLWFVTGGMPPVGMIVRQPLTAFFDGPFIAGGLIVLLTWLVAEFLNRSLLALSLQADEVSHIAKAYGRLSDTVENTLRSDRRAMLDRFIAVWISIGIVVIVLATGSQIRPIEGEGFLTIHAQNIHPRAIVSTIVYFFAGFLLIGQAHLVALRARWALDGVAVDERRFRNWMLYVVGAVGLVAFITSLVPIGDTILLYRAIMAVGRGIMAIMGLLFGVLSAIMGLFGSGGSGEDPGIQPLEIPETFEATEATVRPTPEFDMPTLIFWVFVGIAALIGGYHLLAARGFDWSWIRERLAMFLSLFRRTVDLGWRIVADVVNRVARTDIMPRTRVERQARRNMNLDEQVQFAYLSILDEAEEQGLGRRAAETPRRYAPRLASALSQIIRTRTATDSAADAGSEAEANPAPSPVEEVPDVEAVTESYYKARYSMKTSVEQDLTRAQSLLERIRGLWRRAGDG